MVVQRNINILNMGYHRLALETLKYIKTVNKIISLIESYSLILMFLFVNTFVNAWCVGLVRKGRILLMLFNCDFMLTLTKIDMIIRGWCWWCGRYQLIAPPVKFGMVTLMYLSVSYQFLSVTTSYFFIEIFHTFRDW